MTAVLEVRGVTKAYGDRAVLRGIDLEVDEHAAVALIGASGSGKSTLLRCIDLLEEIDDGDIFLDGDVITDPSVDPVSVRRRLGMVFQAFNLFPHLSALENVALAPVRGHGVAREAHLVRGDQHGHAVGLQLSHELEHVADQLRVEGARDLVQQEEPRPHGEGPQDGDPLLLASGETIRVLARLVGEAEAPQ